MVHFLSITCGEKPTVTIGQNSPYKIQKAAKLSNKKSDAACISVQCNIRLVVLSVFVFLFSDEPEPKHRRVEVDFGVNSGVSTKVPFHCFELYFMT